jgi:hypothetical protein
MAKITKSGTPTVSTGSPSFEHQFAGHVAAVAIEAGDACTINADSEVALWAPGTLFAGIAASSAAVDEPVTLYHGVTFHYGSGLTPGALVYLSVDTSGDLDNAVTTATRPVGFCRDATRIYFFPLSGQTVDLLV